MLSRKKLDYKKKLIYTIIILLNFSIVGYLVFANLLRKPAVPSPLDMPDVYSDEMIEGAATPVTDYSQAPAVGEGAAVLVFDDPMFRGLKIFGNLPIKIDKVGRTNPFDLFEAAIPKE
ncbi:hypothetical protein KKD19_01805 [Patescibacteria group bacterium]|nr:hypothetical protein [Patescibacteria group bacterium]MBU4511963.1 hypothetical protein [Patescibacteria group bacterium]MCG2693367.1 hypothetical protein [Candidatus Parcubacteria bacterium]